MKILIIGAGEVGRYLARVLSQENHQIVMVDHDRTVLERLEESLDIKVVPGHGSSAGVLERAGAWSMDLVLAVTNNDEVNLLAAFLSKVQGARNTVVRIRSPEFLRFHRHFYQRTLGFDSILIPNELCAQEIMELIRTRQAVAVENFADGQIQMRQVQVSERSGWAHQPLAKIKLPRQTLVTAIIRGREITIPSGDTEIRPEDELLVIGRTNAMEELDRITGRPRAGTQMVIIVGGGDLGLAVASALEYSGIRVKLVEQDREQAEVLSGQLNDTTVVHGDGAEVELLREIGAERADVFIAALGEDEKNLLACQLAKKMGAKKVIALVEKPNYVSLYQELGLDAAISPRLLVAQKILRYVRRGAVSSIAVIAEGKAEVIEMKAQAESKVVSAPLGKVGFPRGAIIGSVLRNSEVHIPDGNFQVEPEDSLVIFTFLENLPGVEKLVSGKKRSLLLNLTGGGP